MHDLGLQGVIRGKPVSTMVSDKAVPGPLDQVNRQFHAPAPNTLRVSGFTCVATCAGFVYVAFVIEIYARFIVGRAGMAPANTAPPKAGLRTETR